MYNKFIATLKKHKYHEVFFWIAIAVSFILWTVAFHNDVMGMNGLGDFKLHLKGALSNSKSSYSLLAITIRVLAKINFIDIKILFPAFISAVNIVLILVLRYIFIKANKNQKSYLVDFLSVSTLFIGVIIRLYSTRWYMGVGCPNIHHNPTFIYSRLFAMLAVIFFYYAYNNYKTDKKYGKYLWLFMLAAVICTFIKPSFVFSFGPACAVFLLAELICVKGKDLKTKTFIFALCTGLALIVCIPIMLFQSSALFAAPETTAAASETAESSAVIILSFPEIIKGIFSLKTLEKIVLGLLFPIFIFAINKKELKGTNLLLIINLIISYIYLIVLKETGVRAKHGNFGWSYSIALFFIYLAAVYTMFFKNDTMSEKQKNIGCCLYLIHLLCGLLYFAKYLVFYRFS